MDCPEDGPCVIIAKREWGQSRTGASPVSFPRRWSVIRSPRALRQSQDRLVEGPFMVRQAHHERHQRCQSRQEQPFSSLVVPVASGTADYSENRPLMLPGACRASLPRKRESKVPLVWIPASAVPAPMLDRGNDTRSTGAITPSAILPGLREIPVFILGGAGGKRHGRFPRPRESTLT